MSFDKNKRNTMKIMTGAALATGAVFSPLLASAGCGGAPHASAAAATVALRGTGLTIDFVNDNSVAGARATLTNTTDAPVTLRHVYPGIVSTSNGTYDINSLLENGPRTVLPGQPYTAVMAARNRNIEERSVSGGRRSGVSVAVSTEHKSVHGERVVKTLRTLYS